MKPWGSYERVMYSQFVNVSAGDHKFRGFYITSTSLFPPENMRKPFAFLVFSGAIGRN